MSSIQDRLGEVVGRVFALVQACPSGRVTTYSWLAKAVGYPRGARMVGIIMYEATEGTPAQRVVNSKGELSGSWAFRTPTTMRQRLEEEHIEFTEDGRVDLKQYGWDPVRDLSVDALEHIFQAAEPYLFPPASRLLVRLMTDPASPFRTPEKEKP